MSNWFDQYYGCDGPCPEYERIVNTRQIYSSITEDYKSCLPTPKPFDCTLIAHCTSGGTGGSVTPILIVSNSAYISSPVKDNKYIGNKNNGFSGGDWDITTRSTIRASSFNCGVPLPHSINGSVSDALNVCGNLYVIGNATTTTVEIKVNTFECVEVGDGTLIELGSVSLSCDSGTNKCWSIDVDTDAALTECTTHLLITITVTSEVVPTSIKSSYKATIEKVS